jgi:small GTP-binding protein
MIVDVNTSKSLQKVIHLMFSMSDGPKAQIVLLGARGVGKKSIICRAVLNEFDEDARNTLYAKAVEVGGSTINLHIWTVTGQEQFRSLGPMCYRRLHVALLVFSVTDAASVHDVRTRVEEMKVQVHEMPTLFVVGNKRDLSNRQVQTHEGESLARELNANYCEVSARTGVEIDELFLQVAEEARKRLQRVDGDSASQSKRAGGTC